MRVRLAAKIDFFLQPLIDVAVLPAILEFLFVVELDLRDKKPRSAASFTMGLLIFGSKIGCRRRNVGKTLTTAASELTAAVAAVTTAVKAARNPSRSRW